MTTETKSITSSYTDLAMPEAIQIFAQNKGSVPIELYFGTTPSASAEGLKLMPNTQGFSFSLSAGESCYGKTEGTQNISQAVFIY